MDRVKEIQVPSQKSRVLVIGDPHFKVGNQVQTDALIPFVVEQVERSGCGFVVVLGDVLDRHETIHMSPLTRAIEFLQSIHRTGVYLFVLIGNHDRANNQDFCSPLHPFTALKGWTRTFVVDAPMIVNVQFDMASSPEDVRMRRLALCPYVPPGRFEESLRMLPVDSIENDIDLIFAHQEFRNAKLGAFVSETGDEWPASHPFVISGHIHQYDPLQSNILYTGTPLQLAFSDSDKKVLVCTDLLNEAESSGRYFRPVIDTIDCSSLPGKKVVYISPSDFVESTVHDVLDSLLRSGSQIRVVVAGSKSQIAAVRSTRLFTALSSKVQLVTKLEKTMSSSSSDVVEDVEETSVVGNAECSAAPPRKLQSFQQRLHKTLCDNGKLELLSLWQSVQQAASSPATAAAAAAASVPASRKRT